MHTDVHQLHLCHLAKSLLQLNQLITSPCHFPGDHICNLNPTLTLALKAYSSESLIHGLTHCDTKQDPPQKRSSLQTASLCNFSNLRKRPHDNNTLPSMLRTRNRCQKATNNAQNSTKLQQQHKYGPST